ncbi:NAD(P)H-binding protein [Lichenihabitans psoromatis]|uniref:NAD(P)H-binding protein n=1 Tax=Lichenihabitans psoromatis TaxID=2528642 RepID=UPI0010383C2C|nr:NAD(P)H-binding protein [Lichenihabitans psoromatis]
MSKSSLRLLVTGASGQLGRRVIDDLLAKGPSINVEAIVRDAGAVAALTARGVAAEIADYSKPETLDAAFAGVDRLLLISSNALGERVEQHRNVIAAAKRAGVTLLAYTSVLHADTSALALAEEHRQTEALLRQSGVPFVILRNGWYTENYTASIPAALAHGVMLGSAGHGRIASASRADYAAAAAAVLTATVPQDGRIYELAGDDAYTLAQFAEKVAHVSGQAVVYRDVPEAEYKGILVGAGLPDPIASLLSDSDAAAANDALFDDGRQLSALIGRPTTPWSETIAAALKA